jgi:hypothetical protein
MEVPGFLNEISDEMKEGSDQFYLLALPRGPYLFSKINDLRESGTANRFMMFQGFLDRVSH